MLPFSSLSKSTLVLHSLWFFVTWMLLSQLWHWCVSFLALSSHLSQSWLWCFCLLFDLNACVSSLTLMPLIEGQVWLWCYCVKFVLVSMLQSHVQFESFFFLTILQNASLSTLTLMLHSQTWLWCFPVTFFLDALVSYIYFDLNASVSSLTLMLQSQLWLWCFCYCLSLALDVCFLFMTILLQCHLWLW